MSTAIRSSSPIMSPSTVTVPFESLLLARFASKDPQRPNLNWLRFEPAPSGCNVIATDGHRLAKFNLYCDIGAEPIEILASEVLCFVKAVKKKDRPATVEIRRDMLSTPGLDVPLTPKKDSSTFPPWQQVTPKAYHGPTAPLCFDPTYLTDFVSLLKDMNLNTTVKIEQGDDCLSPLAITPLKQPKCGDLLYILMPCRE